MRPQQQNRRMRGRGNNNNRKGPNPLTRSYESNGPDVKIRGTAQQIADKYSTLARDAQSSGDRVIAENYLQHAEHYNRLIAAAQAQVQPQQPLRDRSDEDDFDERDDQEAAGYPSQPRQQINESSQQANEQRQPVNEQRQRVSEPRPTVNDGSGPQPVIEGTPAEVAYKEAPVEGAKRRKPNGRGNGKANGEAGVVKEAGQAEANPEPAPKEVASKEAAPKVGTASEETAEDAPKPVKRTRRPRVRKTKDAAEDAADVPETEGAAAQS